MLVLRFLGLMFLIYCVGYVLWWVLICGLLLGIIHRLFGKD